ncbi:MAG: hypothetical protein ABSA40_04660 [Candidatus Dormibacteria bacterium]|jgi:hypothetical protein
MGDVTVAGFADTADTREFQDGSRRQTLDLPSMQVGRGVYRPGWRWSLHAGPQTGVPSAAHIGYVESGRMAVRGPDGREVTVGPGEAFEAAPGHDAWVLGDQPCVALDFWPRER